MTEALSSKGVNAMRAKHLVGALLFASVTGVASLSMPRPAEAGPPGPGFCPPGLRDKGCVPPGLQKKFHRGDRIPDWRSYDRLRHREYGLPYPGPDRHYIRIGSDAYLIAEGTQRVIEAINLFDAVGR